MKCIGIIGAMEVEIAAIKQEMQDITVTRKASIDFYYGTISGRKIVAARSGVGKVNAAICTQLMIDEFKAEVIINTGVAGSLNAVIDIGDIVLSTDVLHHDVDACIFGYPKGQIPQMQEFSFPADQALRTLAEKVCYQVNPDIHVYQGRIVSGDQFISENDKKEAIIKTFGGYAVEMEGAAIGQTAYLNGVPFLIIRAISDKADGSDEVEYPVFEKEAARHSVNLTLGLIRQMS